MGSQGSKAQGLRSCASYVVQHRMYSDSVPQLKDHVVSFNWSANVKIDSSDETSVVHPCYCSEIVLTISRCSGFVFDVVRLNRVREEVPVVVVPHVGLNAVAPILSLSLA